MLLDCPSLTLRARTKGSEPNEYKQFDEVQFFHPVIPFYLINTQHYQVLFK